MRGLGSEKICSPHRRDFRARNTRVSTLTCRSEFLLSTGATDVEEAILEAAKAGHIEVLEVFLRHSLQWDERVREVVGEPGVQDHRGRAGEARGACAFDVRFDDGSQARRASAALRSRYATY